MHGVPELVNRSIARAVREIIDGDLSIQDSLQRGYGNISAIARLIAPKVEGAVERRVKVESIITSIKRVRGDYAPPLPQIAEVIGGSVVNVRTDVAKLSVERTKRAIETVRRLLADYHEEFLQVSESISAITLILDQKLVDHMASLFRDDEILEKEVNLAAVIVRSPEAIIKTPGCAIAFYNQISRRHVNIEDTVSCFTDTIIVVRMDEVGRAFTALTELISDARRNLTGKKERRVTVTRQASPSHL